jgi:hypothetical protein
VAARQLSSRTQGTGDAMKVAVADAAALEEGNEENVVDE